jgi:medium-chain acyl-[acyl-carrier-protein] hydrolase
VVHGLVVIFETSASCILMDYKVTPSRLLRVTRPVESPSIRLFCIPYAGGSASIYNDWIVAAPDWLQVCSVELPGRGRLVTESLATSLIELAQTISSAVYPYTNKPYAIFGHSMGALLAYEVASQLESLRRNQLCKLFVSGCGAPFLPRKKPPISHLPDDELLVHLRAMEGTPDEILAHPELIELLLPVLRSDFAICEEYRLIRVHLLQAPLTALSGEHDEDTPEGDMQMWRRLTTGDFRSLTFPGGHFFLNESENDVLSAVCRELEMTSPD